MHKPELSAVLAGENLQTRAMIDTFLAHPDLFHATRYAAIDDTRLLRESRSNHDLPFSEMDTTDALAASYLKTVAWEHFTDALKFACGSTTGARELNWSKVYSIVGDYVTEPRPELLAARKAAHAVKMAQLDADIAAARTEPTLQEIVEVNELIGERISGTVMGVEGDLDWETCETPGLYAAYRKVNEAYRAEQAAIEAEVPGTPNTDPDDLFNFIPIRTEAENARIAELMAQRGPESGRHGKITITKDAEKLVFNSEHDGATVARYTVTVQLPA